MAIKYSDRPQLVYGENRSTLEDIYRRFPANAQPITTAPENGGRLVYVFEPSGQRHVAGFNSRLGWCKAEVKKDAAGAVHWAISDSRIPQPVLWASSQAQHVLHSVVVRVRARAAGLSRCDVVGVLDMRRALGIHQSARVSAIPSFRSLRQISNRGFELIALVHLWSFRLRRVLRMRRLLLHQLGSAL
jgi:hypothetical protein